MKGVVLAVIECSPKIYDFRANGIPVQERVEKVDTLRRMWENHSAYSAIIGDYKFEWSNLCQYL